MEALKILAIVVGHGVQAALGELGLHLLGIPRVDPPAEGIPNRMTWRACAATTPSTPRGAVASGRRGRRRRNDEPTANDNGAHIVTDVEHRLGAVIAPNLPPPEGVVIRGLALVIRALQRKVIEQHGVPAGGLKGSRAGVVSQAGVPARAPPQRPCPKAAIGAATAAIPNA